MKKFAGFLVFTFILYGIASCDPQNTRDRQVERLGEMEAEVLRNLSDTARIRALARAYRKLADEEPQDTACAEFLFKAGLLYRNIPGEGLRAVEHFRLLATRYADHRLAPEAKFNEALTWEVDVEQRQPAAEAYTDFLNKYPDHSLAPLVREQLDLIRIDTSAIETIRRFERQAAEKAPRVEASR